ncbi:MAG: hypothetical protein Hals2KO_15410 [Halioglobus sp.]
MLMDKYTIAIVGSGPAGLSAAAHVAALGPTSIDQPDKTQVHHEAPSHILLEGSAQPSKTIYRFQRGKHVMSEPGYLKLRSDLPFVASTREDVIGAWNDHIDNHDINIQFNAEVVSIGGKKGNFKISLADGSAVGAQHVVLAIGLQGNPRLLDAPGSDSQWVQYQLDDPKEYEGERILVVGSGDSAAENALALAEQNEVIILNRNSEFARVKDGNQAALLRAFANPKTTLSCLYNAQVSAIQPGTDDESRLQVELNTAEGPITLPIDRIIARLGSIPPRKFLESCGMDFVTDAPDALPMLSETYETSTDGLYVIGALAGYPLIKQAMNQGHDVIEFILGRPIKPADHELLEFQFAGLPFGLDVETQLPLMMQRVPMFRQLNPLSFRELVIESSIYASYPDAQSAEEVVQTISKLNAQIEKDYAAEKATPGATRVVAEGDVFYTEGDRGPTFYTIIDGEVLLESSLDSGDARALKPGEFFGEMSLIAGQPRRETARAGRNCVVMETPRRTMLKLMQSHPAVRDGVMWIYSVRELQHHFVPNASVQAIRQIADEIVERSFKPGELLWSSGDSAESLYIVRNGTVALSKHDEDEVVIVGQVRAGELLGETSMFGESIRHETATASVFTEVLEISRALFKKLMHLDSEKLQQLKDVTRDGVLSKAAWEVRPESKGLLDFLLEDGLGEATNALFIDEDLCVGCDNCESACADTHGGITRLDRKAGNSFAGVHVPHACRHCQQPHCMKDCPPNAINRSSTGEVYIDNSCIGCGNCEANCPYNAIKMAHTPPPQVSFWSRLLGSEGKNKNDRAGASVRKDPALAVKCDACIGLDHGPACVNACPTGAAFRLGPDPVSDIIGRAR